MNSYKKLAIIFTAVVLFSIAFLFRGWISKLLDLGSKEEDMPTNSIVPVISLDEKPKPNEITQHKPQPSPVSEIVRKAPSLYIGRDPSEIRPVPEEVKLFTEAQKEQLYSTLKIHAAAVKKDPTYFNGWIQVGMLKKTIGDFEGARDVWEYAGLIEPLNSLSFANLGELYWRYLHDFPKAERNLKISIKHKSNDFQTYITLSDLYYYSYVEKADQADKVLLDGIDANSNDLSVKINLIKALASLYQREKEFAKAVEQWQKVLDLEPGNTEVAETLEALRKKIGP